MVNIDKFTLYAFNWLAYDREIRGLLAVNILLALPEYYIPEKTIRKVNLWAICKKLSRTIFSESVDKDVMKNFAFFGKSKELPIIIFDDYNWRGPKLASFFFLII